MTQYLDHMKTQTFENLDQFSAYLRTRRDNFPMLAYIVFKKIYKQRSYEINFEALVKNQDIIASLMKTHIDESDFKKMKFILSKVTASEINDQNKKAIAYQYEINDMDQFVKLYNTLSEGLHNIQFSDFYE